MKVVVQRVLHSSVTVDKKIVGKIDNGLLILVGFTYNENKENIIKMVNKIYFQYHQKIDLFYLDYL